MSELNEFNKSVTGQDKNPELRELTQKEINIARARGNWDSGYPAIQNPDVDQNGFPKRDLHA